MPRLDICQRFRQRCAHILCAIAKPAAVEEKRMTEYPAPGNAHLATPIDSGRFREAMSRVTGAVHIVTTAGSAGLGGITATSVASITVEPPMMLFCINLESPSAQR